MTHELLVILAGVTLGYFVKGVTGMGGPLVAIPIIATVVGVEHAVVVVSIPNLVANVWMLREHWSGGKGTRPILVPLLAAGAVSTAAGAWLLTALDERVLSLVLATVIGVFLVRFLTDPEFRLSERIGRRLALPVGAVGGLVQGATGSAGPLYATYLHALRLERSSFVFALTVPFQVLGAVQVGTLATLGQFTEPRLFEALVAIIPVLVVSPLGILLARRLPQRVFERAVLAILALAAVRLVVSALG